ncbi:hypothetical protein GCM10027432_20290 [Lysobacter fragariae]
MRIELRLRESPASELATRAYDPDENDIRSILMDVCRAMERRSDLVVSGFGQDRWPVDVGTDLPVLLEQLPDALRAVNVGATAEIDFYEQGIERAITFSPTDGRYVATCTSRTIWQPNPAVEHIDREDLEEMLMAVREVFMHAFAEVAPGLARHPWVRLWLECSPENS